MHITELNSFKLSDAVKFHNRLNPKIWGRDEHLLPEVREKLMAIADNFREFLGVGDLDVRDITISGSNAAYSYTPYSDIDLHLVVEFSADDEVYQELFNAKKYQYNDEHKLSIGGVPVELYVQNAAESPVSQGEYSISREEWIQVPRRKRAKIDDTCVRAKVEDLDARIHSAIRSGNAEAMSRLWDKIKSMRQSGLDAHGEFGCENIVFKILRNKGCIKELRAARTAAQDHELSLKEQDHAPKFHWGFAEGHQGQPYSSPDGVAASTEMFLNEDDTESMVQQFIQDTAERLGIERMPEIQLHDNDGWSEQNRSFGMYQPELHVLHVNLRDRHIMDILRTVAHELAHCRQQELEQLDHTSGNTGSPVENEANAVAGIIMRDFADAHPELFDHEDIRESSGYIPTKAQADDPRFKMALTVDVQPGQTGKEANKMSLATDAQGHPQLLRADGKVKLAESLAAEFELFEEQDLFEINMGSKNLRREAAKTGAIAGMEFEMIVPGMQSDDPEQEPDYDQDERCRSIEDAVRFFHDGDYNGRRDVERLRERMQNDFIEWLDDKIRDAWGMDGEEYLEEWIRNNVDEDEWSNLDEDWRESLDQFVANVYADPSSDYYNQAFDEYREENQDNWDESDWLDAEDLDVMSGVEQMYGMNWPYWTNMNSGEIDADQVADEFSRAVGREVRVNKRYHQSGARPDPNNQFYVVEPDGSLEGDSPGDEGLEFVSPPMPIDELLKDLNAVKEWAGRMGVYTNESTGLHINISVPEYNKDRLDFVKLALLLGDEYVLKQFGRSSNTYARSALGKVRDRVQQRPEEAQRLLDKMKGQMGELASKAIHGGYTDKYTSINTKDGHIEFRSPGGDWLDDNFDKIENTLLRFTVAMSAALNPDAYREEYQKKLYKLLTAKSESANANELSRILSMYLSGQADQKKAAKELAQQAKIRKKSKKEIDSETSGKKYWWNVSNPGNSYASVEVVATSKEEAIEKALGDDGYPSWANTRQSIVAEPVRPYNLDAQSTQDDDTASAFTAPPGSQGGGRPNDPNGRYAIVLRSDPGLYGSFTGPAPDYQFRFNMGNPAEQAQGRYVLQAWAARNNVVAADYMVVDTEQWNRSADAASGGIIDIEPDVAQALPGSTAALAQQRATPGTFSGAWKVMVNGEEVYRFSGVGNNQSDANRVAATWLRNNGRGVSGEGFEVYPIMTEGLAEGKQFNFGNFVVTLGPHAIDQTIDRKVDPKSVEQILQNINQVRSSIMGQPVGAAFILHDGHSTGLGMRRHDNNRLTLATVYSIRPGFTKGKHPTFKVNVDQQLAESASDYELHDRPKLDRVLAKCCRMVVQGQQRDPERYGQVAACVIDPDNRMIYGINLPAKDGTRRHAERVAIDKYRKSIGEIPAGSIIVTTCSPCNSPMEERHGESCKDLLNSVGIHKVYAGYQDPTQHDDRDADFRVYVTENDRLWGECQLFAQTFLGAEELAESTDAKKILNYVKSIHHDFHIDDVILDHPQWQLQRVPLSQLHVPDPESGEDLDDPYNRVQMIDMYHVDDITPQDIESRPIVADTDGHIIDGNHRALAARLRGMATIPAWVPAKQNVAEIFNQPYKTKTEKSDYGDVDMLARLPDGTNLSIMFNKQQNNEGEETIQVEFYRNNSQEVTGEGDAQRIFATVLTSIQKYIKKYKPARLSFSASKATDPTVYYEPDQPQPNPESRAKLYDRLVQRYSKAWGYRAFRADTGDLVIYELSRMKPVTENFAAGIMRANEFIVESDERAIAQAQYMQGECAVLALTIHKMDPQRFPLGFVYEFFDTMPDMYIEPDEFDELDPARQQDIQYNHQNWSLTHAYVYDQKTQKYIDARGSHDSPPNIGHDFNATRHNKFPAKIQDLVNVSSYMEWDEAQEKWIVLRGWDALDKAYTPEGQQRAREYAIKYLGVGDNGGKSIENENFADGKNPQDKGDSKRHGVPTKASVSTLRKVAKQGGRKGQLAHWMANMKAGRAKAKRNK